MGGPVLDTTKSFTVMAWVKPSELTAANGYMNVISQDGVNTSKFMLRYDKDANGRASGWCFNMRPTDVSGTQPVAACATGTVGSSHPPVVNEWVHLAGVYDATTGVIQIHVMGNQASCDGENGVGPLHQHLDRHRPARHRPRLAQRWGHHAVARRHRRRLRLPAHPQLGRDLPTGDSVAENSGLVRRADRPAAPPALPHSPSATDNRVRGPGGRPMGETRRKSKSHWRRYGGWSHRDRATWAAVPFAVMLGVTLLGYQPSLAGPQWTPPAAREVGGIATVDAPKQNSRPAWSAEAEAHARPRAGARPKVTWPSERSTTVDLPAATALLVRPSSAASSAALVGQADGEARPGRDRTAGAGRPGRLGCRSGDDRRGRAVRPDDGAGVRPGEGGQGRGRGPVVQPGPAGQRSSVRRWWTSTIASFAASVRR